VVVLSVRMVLEVVRIDRRFWPGGRGPKAWTLQR
jgi:hypothetical protein